MKLTTQLFMLGAIGAATYGAVRALRRPRSSGPESMFDPSKVADISAISDLDDIIVDEPVIVAEDFVVITDEPYEEDDEMPPGISKT